MDRMFQRMMARMEKRFAGQYFLVTGATGGNGGAMARWLLSLGAYVIATGRTKLFLDVLKQDALAAGCLKNVRTCAADLCRPEDRARLVQVVREFVGENTLGGIFHLAGTTVIKMDPTCEEIALFEQGDLYGPKDLVESLIDILDSRAIVAVNTSIAMHFPEIPVIRDYIRVKRLVAEWTRGMRDELGQTGIHVMLIQMGFIASNIWNRPEHRTRLSAKMIGTFGSESPRISMGKVLLAVLEGEEEPFVGRFPRVLTAVSSSVLRPWFASMVQWGTTNLIQEG